ncbi:hypothetical protein GVAV_003003 [Gurleya vavrai]
MQLLENFFFFEFSYEIDLSLVDFDVKENEIDDNLKIFFCKYSCRSKLRTIILISFFNYYGLLIDYIFEKSKFQHGFENKEQFVKVHASIGFISQHLRKIFDNFDIDYNDTYLNIIENYRSYFPEIFHKYLLNHLK